jgi:hypothetical protein
MIKKKVLISLTLVGFLFLLSDAFALSFNDLSSFEAATSSLALIDFDSDPMGDPTPGFGEIGSTYNSLGITFAAGNVFEDSFTGPVSEPNGWLSNNLDGDDRIFEAEFLVGGITAVGVHNVYNGSTPSGAYLEAYDAFDNLLEIVQSDNDNVTKDFFGVTTAVSIEKIVVRVLDPAGWGLDDLYFGQAASVPEPATMLLLGIGLAGLAGVSRKKLKK